MVAGVFPVPQPAEKLYTVTPIASTEQVYDEIVAVVFSPACAVRKETRRPVKIPTISALPVAFVLLVSACAQPSNSWASHEDASPAASAPPSPAASAQVSTRTAVATVAVGKPIELATMGPLRYTMTVSNLRTGMPSDMDLLMKPKHGQWIVVDATFSNSNSVIPFANAGIFRLVLADGKHEMAMTLGGVRGTDITLNWIKTLEKGQTFTGQVMFDAPADLNGVRISIMELDQDVAFWTLT